MANEDPREGSKHAPKPEIAAADWLFKDDPGVKSPKQSHIPALSSGPSEVFDLADGPGPDELAPPIPPVPEREKTAAKPREGRTERTHDKPRLEPSALVEQTWSRSAEWGPNLLIVGGWLVLVFCVIYFYLSGLEHMIGPVFLALVLGGLVAVVLSYPILITLERPVRVTPEQAVRDYYSALSHHLPHLRRMWLLLSTSGRISNAYGSFEGFKGYWRDRLRNLREGHAGQWTPLVFEIVNFKADKSAGKTMIDAEFTVNVSVRGQRNAGPIHTIPMRMALVRGPDKMWYLENGTLTRASKGRPTGDNP
jgi:hypothetical protein